MPVYFRLQWRAFIGRPVQRAAAIAANRRRAVHRLHLAAPLPAQLYDRPPLLVFWDLLLVLLLQCLLPLAVRSVAGASVTAHRRWRACKTAHFLLVSNVTMAESKQPSFIAGLSLPSHSGMCHFVWST